MRLLRFDVDCVCAISMYTYTRVCACARARTSRFHKHAGMFAKISLEGLTGNLNFPVVLGTCIRG